MLLPRRLILGGYRLEESEMEAIMVRCLWPLGSRRADGIRPTVTHMDVRAQTLTSLPLRHPFSLEQSGGATNLA
jgi:hypothetical protein